MAEVVNNYPYGDRGYIYQYDTEKHSATITGVSDKEVELIDIPSSIIGKDGSSYAVTAIGGSAFSGCSKLRRLVLPETLRSIGSNAFSGCSDLKHIWCKVVNPSVNTLKPGNLPDGNTTSNLVTLYVPSESSKSLYEEDQDWNAKFSGRIFVSGMSEPFNYKVDGDQTGMSYICAEGSRVAMLYRGKNEKNIVVPSEIEKDGTTFRVVGIDRQAFIGFSDIESITISEYVTAIGAEAFSGCSKLETIKLPSTLTTIKSNAFKGCSKLVRVESRALAFDIPKDLFSSANSNEKTLYVYNNPGADIDAYKDHEGWTKFTYYMQGEMDPFSYTDENGVIMNFIGAKNFGEATLVKVSETDAKKISIPYSIPGHDYVVSVINKNAFAEAKDLEQLIFEDAEGAGDSGKELRIGESALSGCSNLKVLILPERLSRIGKQAFSDCKNLAHVSFKKDPANIVIGDNVFNSSTKSKASLYVPDGYSNSILSWEKTKIIECLSMESFNDNGLSYVGWVDSASEKSAVLVKGVSGSSGSTFSIPTSAYSSRSTITYNVTAIGENAFKGIGAFEILNIQSGINRIDANAFQGLTSLKTVTLPSGLTTIGDNAFNGCNQLSEVNFKDVTTIGMNAFRSCSKLPNVLELAKVENLGANAFQGCTSLERIVLPSTLTSIGDNAFSGCNNLIEVESNSNNPGSIADKTVFPKDDIILYVPSGSSVKSNYSNRGWNFWRIYGGGRETQEKDGLIYAYGKDEDVAVLLKNNDLNNTSPTIEPKVPGTEKLVTVIAKSAFSGKNKFKSLTIPDAVEAIGKNAFLNCSGLEKVTWPSKLKYIGDYAFGSTSLASVEFPSATETIGENAFRYCTKIEDLSFPQSLTSIGNYAFYDSKKLAKINTECSAFTLKGETFWPVPNIKIYVPSSEKSNYIEKWGNIFSNAECFISGQTGYGYDINNWYYKYMYLADTGTGTAILKKANNSTVDHGFQTIPDEVEIIGVNLGNFKLTEIGASAFAEYQGKGDVNNLTIGANVEKIGDNAFNGCKNLKELHIEGANTIGKYAFQSCSNLNKIWLPRTLTTIEEKAFEYCNGISHVISKMESPSLMSYEIFSIPENNTATLFVPSKTGYTTS